MEDRIGGESSGKGQAEGKRKRDGGYFDDHGSFYDIETEFNALQYCALFPPDYEFERDILVQAWIALKLFVQEPMERFAGHFFDYCLRKGYFTERTNLVTGKALYRLEKGFEDSTRLYMLLTSQMFNSKIDLNCFNRIEGSFHIKTVSSKVTHVSIRCGDLEDGTELLSFQRVEQLRALIFLHGHELRFNQLPRKIFLSLKELRVLELSKTRLKDLPSSISSMKCLCLLDLSYTLIKRLPEALHHLEELQTLRLRGCLNLSTLPKGIRKLVNLRHLDFDVFGQLDSMPEGLGDLINIQTLYAFLVGVEKGCSIRQLENLNNISGSFCISRLEKVLTKDEAKVARLSSKSNIKVLELHWSDSLDEDAARYEDVLSSLRPNTSLEKLTISCYGGSNLPSWICDPEFSNLVAITLEMCENCSELPLLGQLPSLKFLHIIDLPKVKVIDHRFYGNPGIQGYTAFSRLEKLSVENMSSLEEWLDISKKIRLRCSELNNFPRLLSLRVKHCPKLHTICTLSSLDTLEELEIIDCRLLASCADDVLSHQLKTFIIDDCPLISARFANGGEDWQKVAHIRQLYVD